MEEHRIATLLDWQPIGVGRRRAPCPRCGMAIELRLMDDLIEVACPGCGAGPLFERTQDYEAARGSTSTGQLLVALGLLTEDELAQADEAAGPGGSTDGADGTERADSADGAGRDQRGLVGAARALGFFRKSLYLCVAPDDVHDLVIRPLRELLSTAQLQEAVELERSEGRPAGEVIGDVALTSEKDKLRARGGEPSIELDELDVPEEVRRLVPAGIASSLLAIPVRLEEETLVVALSDPLDFEAIDQLKLYVGREVTAVAAEEASLFRALERLFPDGAMDEADDEMESDLALLTEEDSLEATTVAPTSDLPEPAPGSRTLTALLRQATEEEATQIILEPLDIYYRVRVRRGHRLRDAARVPRPVGRAVVQQAMVRAGMDASRPETAQTGRIDVRTRNEHASFRAAVAPAAFGPTLALTREAAGVRLLPLESLALVPGDAQLLRSLLDSRPGLTVIAAPPEGGKTTLLYALLRGSDRARQHVVSLERWARRRVEGATQLIGPEYRCYAASLAQLRPDRVLFDDLPGPPGTATGGDEVRMAVDLAYSGSHVVCTVEAPDPISALGRLITAGVEAHVLLCAVQTLCSVRLVRRICQRCREDFEAPKELAAALRLPDGGTGSRIATGIGCWECDGRGYRGRSALYEVVPLTDPALREAAGTLDRARFASAARTAGHRLLPEKARAALGAGLTSVPEVEALLTTSWE